MKSIWLKLAWNWKSLQTNIGKDYNAKNWEFQNERFNFRFPNW